MKKAEIAVTTLVKIVILVFLLILLAIFIGGDSFRGQILDRTRNFLPWFNFTEPKPQGIELIRYDIPADKVQWYDGTSWLNFGGNSATLGKKKLSESATHNAYTALYYLTPLPSKTEKLKASAGSPYSNPEIPATFCISLNQFGSSAKYTLLQTDIAKFEILFGEKQTGIFVTTPTNNVQKNFYYKTTQNLVGQAQDSNSNIKFTITSNPVDKEFSGHVANLNNRPFKDLEEGKIYGEQFNTEFSRYGLTGTQRDTQIKLLYNAGGTCTDKLFGVFLLNPQAKMSFKRIDIEDYIKTKEPKINAQGSPEDAQQVWNSGYIEIKYLADNWRDQTLKTPITLNYLEDNKQVSNSFCIEKRAGIYLLVDLTKPVSKDAKC